jgi:anti-sigma28 factor (negative regulator of flagellin synthesis)
MADIASIPSAVVHGAMTGRLTGASSAAMREAAQTAYRAQKQESRGSDQVQISPSARYLAMMKGLPEIREDLVEDARARIASGEMDTPERLDRAMDEMIGDFEGKA